MKAPPQLRRYLPAGSDLTTDQAALAAAVLAIDACIERQGAAWGKSFVRLLLARYFAAEGGARELAGRDDGLDQLDNESARAVRKLVEALESADHRAGRVTIAERVAAGDLIPQETPA